MPRYEEPRKRGRTDAPATPREIILKRQVNNFSHARKSVLAILAEIFKNSNNPTHDIQRINGKKRIRDLVITLEELRNIGCNALIARQLGFPLTELVKYYKPMELIDAGYKPKEIVNALKK